MKKVITTSSLKIILAIIWAFSLITVSTCLLRAQESTVYVDASYIGPEYGTDTRPFNTIQEAVAYAVDGDTVLVMPGIYTENVFIYNENIALRSQAGPESTIIDGRDSHSAIRAIFVDKEAAATVEGFTLRNAGWFAALDLNMDESPIITVRINDNTIINSQAGIHLHCENEAEYDVLVTHNRILENLIGDAGFQYGGIGIDASQGQGTITIANNIVAQNNSGAIGIQVSDTQLQVNVVNNTIYSNTHIVPGGFAGIAVDTPHLNLVNNIIFNNRTTGQNQDLNIVQNTPSQIVAANIIGSGQFDGENGNIAVDPLLVDPTRHNYHLRSTSPAIDAGVEVSNLTDVEGDGRPNDGDRANGPQWDIGADEYYPVLWHTTKTVDADTALPGEVLTYTIELQNDGDAHLSGVQVTDSLPGSLTYLQDSFSATNGSFSQNDQLITWIGDISPTQVVTITYAATISNMVVAGTSITNTVTINDGIAALQRDAVVTVLSPSQRATDIVYLPVVAAGSSNCLPLYADNFGNPRSGWPIGEDENYKRGYVNGEYQILAKTPLRTLGVEPNLNPDLRFSDYVAAVDARIKNDNLGLFGLAFGIPDDWEYFYTFMIQINDGLGSYLLFRHRIYNDVDYATVLASGTTDKIKTSLGDTNRLKVERNGPLIRAYINGYPVAGVLDDTLTGPRQVGLYASTPYGYDSEFDIRFDNFVIYPIMCSALRVNSVEDMSSAGVRTFRIRQ